MRSMTQRWQGHLEEERLVDLALGEGLSDVERAHLDDCALCRASLASLTRTVAVTRDTADVDLVAPDQDLWPRIKAELGHEVNSSASGDSSVVSDPAPSSAPSPTTLGPSRHRAATRPRLSWLVAACAAGTLLGAGVVVVADRLGSDEPTATRTIATAELDTLDTNQGLGVATVSKQDEDVTLDVALREREPAEGYVEVWLLNRDGQRMVSVGVLRDGAKRGSFPISQQLLDKGYVTVDLSREQFDDKPQHSGDSIVRGSLTPRA